MEKKREKCWLSFIVIVYALALLCLVIATATTAYAFTGHVFGVRETDPFINSLMAKYGVIKGLIVAFLISSLAFFLLPLGLFMLLNFSMRDDDDVKRRDSIIYALAPAWGMSILFAYLMDATNDVSLILFHRSPISINQLNEFFSLFFLALLSGIFFLIFWFLFDFSMRKPESKEKVSAGHNECGHEFN